MIVRRNFLAGAAGILGSTAAVAALGTNTADAATSAVVTPRAPAAVKIAAATSAPIWADEFTGPAGSAPDPASWSYQYGRYGVNERQYYTDSPRNSWLNGAGSLIIYPRCEITPDLAAAPQNYTSARLVTRGKQEFVPPVRIQASIKVPAGFGIMPAFWSLGNDPARPEAWPHEGEIDIMEAIRIGYPTSFVPMSIHGPAIGSDSEVSMGYTLHNNVGLDGSFHRYGIDWFADHLDFHLDDVVIYSITADQYTAVGGDWTAFSGAWPRYLLLNIAVLSTDPSQIQLQPMFIDWVRVWSLA